MAGELRVWAPFREVDRFRRDLDDLFDRFLGGNARSQTPAFVPALECFVDGNDLVIRADLPGIDPKEVEVTVSGKQLTIRGRRKSQHEEKGHNYLHREVSYGSFERTLTLPAGVRAEDVKASYDSGVLELRATMSKEPGRRKVPIQIEEQSPPRRK